MKTPWKYLVELASRGRTVKAADNPPETEAEDPADEVADPIVEALRKEESRLDAPSSDNAVVAADEDDRTPLLQSSRQRPTLRGSFQNPSGHHSQQRRKGGGPAGKQPSMLQCRRSPSMEMAVPVPHSRL
jgi:hypothetical protein